MSTGSVVSPPYDELCNYRGYIQRNGACDCADGYAELDCRGDLTTALGRMRYNVFNGVAIGTWSLLSLFIIYRTYGVVRAKQMIRVDERRQAANRRLTAAEALMFQSCWYRLRHGMWTSARDMGIDGQSTCLLALSLASVTILLSSAVGQKKNALVSQVLLMLGVLFIEVAGGTLARFFASIVQRFHPPTARMIRILDIFTVIYSFVAFISIMGMTVTIDLLDWPYLTMIVAHASYLLFIVVSSFWYARSVLATQLRNLKTPHVPATKLATRTSNQQRTAGNSTSTPMPGSSVQQAIPVNTGGIRERHAGDQERITTLRWVLHALTGLQIVGVFVVAAFGASTVVFDGTAYGAALASNTIGWFAPWIAALLMVIVMGRAPKVGTTAQIAKDTVIPSALGARGSSNGGNGEGSHHIPNTPNSPLQATVSDGGGVGQQVRSPPIAPHRLGSTSVESSHIGNLALSPPNPNRYQAWSLPTAPAAAILPLPVPSAAIPYQRPTSSPLPPDDTTAATSPNGGGGPTSPKTDGEAPASPIGQDQPLLVAAVDH